MLSSFATPEDMASVSGGEITASTHPGLQLQLDGATESIRRECGWHIATREVRTLRRVERFPRVVFLPAMEIAAVNQAFVNGAEVDPDLIEFDPGTGETNLYARAVTVVYDAGFSTVPTDVKLLSLEMAAAGVGAGLGLLREQAGSVVAAYRSASVEPTDAGRLSPYKLGPIP